MAVELTERGRALLAERRARRENARSSRALACRDAFLDWCYAWTSSKGYVPDIDAFSSDVRSYFEGGPFSPAEIAWASKHLRDIGMITGPEVEGVGIVRPNITPRGRTVVEDYDRRSRPTTRARLSRARDGRNCQTRGGSQPSGSLTSRVDPARVGSRQLAARREPRQCGSTSSKSRHLSRSRAGSVGMRVSSSSHWRFAGLAISKAPWFDGNRSAVPDVLSAPDRRYFQDECQPHAVRAMAVVRVDAQCREAVDGLLETITEHMAIATADAVTIRQLSRDGQDLVPVAVHDVDQARAAAMASIMRQTQRANEGLWKPVVQNQMPLGWQIPAGDTARRG